MKARKKPVEIEFYDTLERWKPDWFLDAVSEGKIIAHVEAEDYSPFHYQPLSYCEVVTLEGMMIAKAGDIIIKGVQGELYPCKREIFFETYEMEIVDNYSSERIKKNRRRK